jgi:aminodeoxyfutalosine deaminase
VASLAEHPVRRFYDAGVPIVLNTDNPALLGCTLRSEYDLARRDFGFTQEELAGLAANGLPLCVCREFLGR